MGLETLVLPDHWRSRLGTWDLSMWDAIVVHNEYNLGTGFENSDVAIDVGAHIGCFSWLAIQNGFGKVYAYEVDPANFALLQHNVGPVNVEAHHSAVWRSDKAESVFLNQCHEPVNTGGHSLVGRDISAAVEVSSVTPFDEIVFRASAGAPYGRVRLVKMDCEGSEFPILYTSQTLDLVDEILGEYHLKDDEVPDRLREFSFDMGDLKKHLEGAGFTVTSSPSSTYLGHFHATR